MTVEELHSLASKVSSDGKMVGHIHLAIPVETKPRGFRVRLGAQFGPMGNALKLKAREGGGMWCLALFNAAAIRKFCIGVSK